MIDRRLHAAAWMVVLVVGLAMMIQPEPEQPAVIVGDPPLVVELPSRLEAQRISFAYSEKTWVKAPPGWGFNDYSSVNGPWMLIPAGSNVLVRVIPERRILLVESHTPGKSPYVMWRP